MPFPAQFYDFKIQIAILQISKFDLNLDLRSKIRIRHLIVRAYYVLGVFYAISDQVLKSSQFQTKTNVLYLVLLPVLFAGTLNFKINYLKIRPIYYSIHS